MHEGDEVFQLSFFLPLQSREYRHAPLPGDHSVAVNGCQLLVHIPDNGNAPPSLLVKVIGPSREMVFEQARRFLRVTLGPGTRSIDALLRTPARYASIVGGRPRLVGHGGSDAVTILVNVDIGFVFTAMPCDLGEPAAAADPADRQLARAKG